MSAQNTRASRLAIRKETTEGTLLDISSGTQFIPLQPGFEFVPGVESIENQEIRGSIGNAAPIQGIEQPTASFNEYLKHSGVEGTAPNWGALLEALFGTVSSNATQRLTAAACTAILIKLAAGGSDFPRGTPMLVKDGTNGYSIRFSDGFSTNDVTPNFSLTAPASGIGVGKAVLYTPADSGHPTLSLWMLRANGAAKEAITGARVTQMSMDVTVGQLINLSFQLEGLGYYFDPVRIDATNCKIDFTDDDGTFTASIPQKVYKSPLELARAAAAAMDAANAGETHSVSYSSSTGKYTFTSTGTVLSLLWKTGTNGSDGTATAATAVFGFTAATDKTGTAASTGYTSNNAITLTDSNTPSYDSSDPMVAKNMEVLVGGSQASFGSICVQNFKMNINNTRTPLKCINAESGVGGSIINARTCEIVIVATLDQYDADKFDKFINNTDVKFQFSFGVKSGGNWVAGKSGGVYSPTAKISAFKLGDDNGIVTMEYTIKPYVNASGQPEVYMGFV